jgi:hypothetical protein
MMTVTLLMLTLVTGCNTAETGRRVPRVLAQSRQKTAPPAKPIDTLTTTNTTKPTPPVEKPVDLHAPAAITPPNALPPGKPVDTEKTTLDKKETEGAKTTTNDAKAVSNRSDKLPKGFMLAEDIHRQDPFIPRPSTDASITSGNAKPPATVDLLSMFNPKKPVAEPSKPATPQTKPDTPAPVIKIPIISVKGIVTSATQAAALLSDDEGRTQTVKPGDLTYLSLLPSRVVSITGKQVVLQEQGSLKKQFIPIPNIIGFRAADAAEKGGNNKTVATLPTMPGNPQAVTLPSLVPPPATGNKAPAKKSTQVANTGKGVMTSANGIIVLPNKGNAPVNPNQPLTLTSPEPPTLRVEKVTP